MRPRPTAGTKPRWQPPRACRCGRADFGRRAGARAPPCRPPCVDCWSGRATKTRSIGVSIGPGQTAFTRIFSRAVAFRHGPHKPDHAVLGRRIDRRERRSGQARRRGREQERAAASRAQLRQRRLGRDQHGAQIERHRQIEILHVDPLDRRGPRMADVVPDEVEPAERPRGLLHDPPRVVVAREIGNDRMRPPACGRDFGDNRFHSGPVDVDHADCRAFAGKAQRARASHARGGRRHDPDLVLQAHGVLLDVLVR